METTLELIGTATAILRLGPFTLLTDPSFLRRGRRAHLGRGVWSKRLTEPSMQPEDLPDLDGVLLSHLRGDHFDRSARTGLDRSLPILTTRAAARRLTRWGFHGAEAMATWQTHDVHHSRGFEAQLRITAVPGRRVRGRLPGTPPEVMGSVVELRGDGQQRFRVYVTGDAVVGPWLADVVHRVGPIDAMVVHLGGTRVLGTTVTMDGRMGADLVELIRPRLTVPVHHEDFGAFRSPLADFLKANRERRLPSRVRTVERGQVVSLDASDLAG